MQAARGASLSPSDPDDRPPARRPSASPPAGALRRASPLAAYALDLGHQDPRGPSTSTDGADVDLVGDLLGLHLARNPGAAFSTGTDYTVVLSCLAVVAVVVVLWLSRRLGSPLLGGRRSACCWPASPAT